MMVLAFSASALLLLVPVASAAEQPHWTFATSGNSRIELPEFLASGFSRALMENGSEYGTAYEPADRAIQLKQFRTEARERPCAYLVRSYEGNVKAMTYKLDRPHLGVLSGYTDESDATIFYAACRRDEGPVWCIDIRYPVRERGIYDPIVARTATSFRR